MGLYQDLVENMGLKACSNNCKYCRTGRTFCIHSKELEGIYWYYETDRFIIDIHDFFVKKDRISGTFPDMGQMFFYSSYIITCNGECFNPYQTLSSNTMYLANGGKNDVQFLLHGNFPYLAVGINFKDKMISEYLTCIDSRLKINISDMFFDTRELVTNPLEKIASSILNCNMISPAAEIFFEAKAKEWLSITLDAYLNQEKTKQISKDDELAVEKVANYISDHYALDIPQELLEKIAMMSGTKLKNLFKQKYQMSITEYSQRKRMNIAETLLLTTTLEIKDVAKSVGYSSHSKFTTYFKKYKGMYPREVKKLGSICDNQPKHICPQS